VRRTPASPGLFLASALLALAAVAVALFTQYKWGMQPCPWCVLQRLQFVLVAAVALLGALASQLRFLRAARGLALLLLGLAGSGVAAALWQHFVASAKDSCKMSLADQINRGLGLDELWPEVFGAFASCADGAAKLLGVPYELYSLAVFVVLGAAAVMLLRRPTRVALR
jgi:protein dithiol:quinone oxidoreductase